MIKILIILFLITTFSFADDCDKRASIFNMLVKSISSKTYPNIYMHKNIKSLEKNSKDLNLIKVCKDADVVLLSTIKNIPKDCDGKILFGTKYSHLKNKNVVGAFFWQKGRPNILFYKNRLKKYNIKLPAKFDKYIEVE